MARPVSLTARANSFICSSKFDQAKPLLDLAIQTNPKDVEALLVRAKLYAMMDPPNNVLALKDARRAVELSPEDPVAQQLCGAAYFAAGRGNEAMSCYERSLRLSRGLPSMSGLLVDLVICMTRSSKHISTLDGAKEWLSEPPADSIGTACRVIVLSHLERGNEVLRLADSSPPVDGACAALKAARALALVRANLPQEAMQCAEQALRQLPGCAAVLMIRGKARFNTGDANGALADFEAARRGLQAGKRAPDTRLDVNIAATKLRLGRFEDTKADLLSVISKDPKNAAAWMNMASLNMQMDRPSDAVNNLNAALGANPGCLLARTMRGLAFLKSGAPHLAINDLYKVCKQRPDAPAKRLLKSALEHIADEHCLYEESPSKKARTGITVDELSAIEALKCLGSVAM